MYVSQATLLPHPQTCSFCSYYNCVLPAMMIALWILTPMFRSLKGFWLKHTLRTTFLFRYKSIALLLVVVSFIVFFGLFSVQVLMELYLVTCSSNMFCCVLPQEHFNYYTMDAALGHLVFSMKYDVIGDQEHLRLMLRYNTNVAVFFFTVVTLPFVYLDPLYVIITICDFAIAVPHIYTNSFFFTNTSDRRLLTVLLLMSM